MPQPYDYASVLAAGQRLVPDMRAQMFEDEQREMQREQFGWQRQAMAQRQAAAEAEAQEKAAYQTSLEAALTDGSPQSIMRLMARFPEMAEGIKPLWESMDERQRVGDLTQIGTIYARGQAGDIAGAASVLRQRVDADRAANAVDPADEAVLAGLESDDPIQQRAALATIGIQLAALTPDKFSETYGRLNPSEATPAVQREYQWRVGQFGKAAADRWLTMEDESIVTVPGGGPVYRKSDIVNGGAPAQPEGGDQSTAPTGSAIEAAALAAVPNVGVSSRQRSPARNREVGGVADSYHLTDQARDFLPPRGMTMTQLAARLKSAMPGFDVINEGDHVHVEPSSRTAGVVPVRSRQEYDRLPSGAAYIAPDGSQRVKG